MCPESDLGTDQQLLRLYQTMGEWRKAQAVCKKKQRRAFGVVPLWAGLVAHHARPARSGTQTLGRCRGCHARGGRNLLRQPSEEELEAEYDAALEEMGADLEQFELEDEREWAGGETPLNRSRLAMVTYYQDCGHL